MPKLRTLSGGEIWSVRTAGEIMLRRNKSGSFTLHAAVLALWLAACLIPLPAFAQKPEYKFYYEFRTQFLPKIQDENKWALTNSDVLERYAANLRRDGVSDAEIARRVTLINTQKPALDADYYNRYYLAGNSNFNHAPNQLLTEVIKDRRPGTALDYGMGEGRNSIYLARLGWEVWGFDPADAGVALAQQRANDLGLTLHTQAVRDSDYDFGREKFDLILFSWTMPLVPLQKVIDALKPGGIVVMECGREFYGGGNQMLHKFDALEIIRFAMVRAQSDWTDRRETDIFRLVARKP